MEESSFDQSSYYPADPHSIEELVRLQQQDSYMNQRLRYSQSKESTLFPPAFTPEPGKRILDLGCGPGGWVLEAAHIFPQCKVLGLDNNEERIEFARKQAVTSNGQNAEFIVGDFAELEKEVPLASIDFLHARFLKWFTPDYKQLVQKWLAVVKPGGILCLVEGESHITNSTAFEEMIKRGSLALASQQRTGFHAITLTLRNMLQELGLQEIQEIAHVINFSAGIQKREPFLADMSDGLRSIGRRLLQRGGLSEKEADHLVNECITDLWENPEFRGLQYFLSVYGVRP